MREELVNASLYLTGDLESVRVATLSVEEEGRVVAVHVGEGDKVETGEVLVELETTLLRLRVERDAARASGRQAELARDRVDYDSQRALFEEGIIGHTVFAEVEGDFRLAGANVAEASAELALSREALRRATVVAPFSGVIALVPCELGEWMDSGDEVAVLATERLEVVVDVPELQMPHVRLGQRAQITVDAHPGQEFSGRVVTVVPVADLTNRTYPVHIEVEDTRDILLPGMFARVVLQTHEPAPTLLMSADALVDRGRGPEVWLVAEGLDGLTANPQRVVVGRRRGADIEVLSGLGVGDRVVTAGHGALFPGTSVTLPGDQIPRPGPAGGPPE